MPRVTEDDPHSDEMKTSSEVEIDDTAILLAVTGPRGERLKVIERDIFEQLDQLAIF